MADRPTREMETTMGKHKVVLQEWATGGDKRALANEKDEARRQRIMIERLVVSVDGKTDVVQQIDSMHGKDFDAVFIALANILRASSLSEEKGGQ